MIRVERMIYDDNNDEYRMTCCLHNYFFFYPSSMRVKEYDRVNIKHMDEAL